MIWIWEQLRRFVVKYFLKPTVKLVFPVCPPPQEILAAPDLQKAGSMGSAEPNFFSFNICWGMTIKMFFCNPFPAPADCSILCCLLFLSAPVVRIQSNCEAANTTGYWVLCSAGGAITWDWVLHLEAIDWLEKSGWGREQRGRNEIFNSWDLSP